MTEIAGLTSEEIMQRVHEDDYHDGPEDEPV